MSFMIGIDAGAAAGNILEAASLKADNIQSLVLMQALLIAVEVANDSLGLSHQKFIILSITRRALCFKSIGQVVTQLNSRHINY